MVDGKSRAYETAAEVQSRARRGRLSIIWDSSKVQPICPASPRKLSLSYNPGDIPDGANAARFNWRGFMSVDFQSVASPRVTFTVAITHSKRGNIREGPKQTFVGGNARQMMGGWAMRAMEKLLC